MYLQNYVRFKLGFYSKAALWTDLKEAGESIPSDIKYANAQLNCCTEQLGVPEAVVLQTGPTEDVQEYCNYLNHSTITEDWFR